MLTAALAALAAAAPAAADPSERPEELDACLEQAQGMTMMVTFCLSDEVTRQEGSLKAAYDNAVAVSEESQRAGVIRSQADWLRYRDGWCEAKGAFAGSGSSEYRLQCLIRLTEQRITELNRMDEP
ncbi:MAG: DUF1311 domain-containing protein [Caulobacteraceae bacterium]|nr:DUF1311 domain-containing protein [Caulobacteraceae bacterium]